MDKNSADTTLRPIAGGSDKTEQSSAERTVNDHVLRYIHEKAAHPCLDTMTWRCAGSTWTYTEKELAGFVWMRAPHLPRALFDMVVHQITRSLREAEIGRAKGKLLADTTAQDSLRGAQELERWVRLVSHPETSPERLQYYFTVMRQLIWQVKRRLRGERTYWEVMPVLVGGQGSGKSSAVEKLAAPLGLLFQADADFTIFTDSFRIGCMNRAYLIRLDEMGKARKSDIERVKNCITARTLQSRVMRSEQERRIERNASFIGTSNHSLVEDVSDSTGMRRFAEIRCLDTAYTREWGDAIRGIDYDLLWACESGLDEDAPMANKREIVEKFQAETRVESDFEWFVSNEVEHTGEHDDTLFNSDAYSRYRDTTLGHAARPMAIQLFARRMRARFGEPLKPGNKTMWRGVRLNPSDA